MLETILGSTNSERVLMFLFVRNQGYARQIARFFNTGLDPIQKQLEKLEAGGVLVSQPVGRTRVFTFNPRYPFSYELRALLEKAFEFYPKDLRDELLLDRRRPRRSGKPL